MHELVGTTLKLHFDFVDLLRVIAQQGLIRGQVVERFLGDDRERASRGIGWRRASIGRTALHARHLQAGAPNFLSNTLFFVSRKPGESPPRAHRSSGMPAAQTEETILTEPNVEVVVGSNVLSGRGLLTVSST